MAENEKNMKELLDEGLKARNEAFGPDDDEEDEEHDFDNENKQKDNNKEANENVNLNQPIPGQSGETKDKGHESGKIPQSRIDELEKKFGGGSNDTSKMQVSEEEGGRKFGMVPPGFKKTNPAPPPPERESSLKRDNSENTLYDPQSNSGSPKTLSRSSSADTIAKENQNINNRVVTVNNVDASTNQYNEAYKKIQDEHISEQIYDEILTVGERVKKYEENVVGKSDSSSEYDKKIAKKIQEDRNVAGLAQENNYGSEETKKELEDLEKMHKVTGRSKPNNNEELHSGLAQKNSYGSKETKKELEDLEKMHKVTGRSKPNEGKIEHKIAKVVEMKETKQPSRSVVYEEVDEAKNNIKENETKQPSKSIVYDPIVEDLSSQGPEYQVGCDDTNINVFDKGGPNEEKYGNDLDDKKFNTMRSMGDNANSSNNKRKYNYLQNKCNREKNRVDRQREGLKIAKAFNDELGFELEAKGIKNINVMYSKGKFTVQLIGSGKKVETYELSKEVADEILAGNTGLISELKSDIRNKMKMRNVAKANDANYDDVQENLGKYSSGLGYMIDKLEGVEKEGKKYYQIFKSSKITKDGQNIKNLSKEDRKEIEEVVNKATRIGKWWARGNKQSIIEKYGASEIKEDEGIPQEHMEVAENKEVDKKVEIGKEQSMEKEQSVDKGLDMDKGQSVDKELEGKVQNMDENDKDMAMKKFIKVFGGPSLSGARSGDSTTKTPQLKKSHSVNDIDKIDENKKHDILSKAETKGKEQETKGKEQETKVNVLIKYKDEEKDKNKNGRTI